MPRKTPDDESIFTIDPAQLKKNVAKVLTAFDEIEALLPGLISLTTEDRVHTQGRLRDGESNALRSVMKACDAAPNLFESLADKDHGTDDKKLETAPTLDALERIDILAPLVARIGTLSTEVSDSTLHLGELVRDVTTPAYGIVKANANTNPKVKTAAAPALKFFADIGRKSARTKVAAKKPAK